MGTALTKPKRPEFSWFGKPTTLQFKAPTLRFDSLRKPRRFCSITRNFIPVLPDMERTLFLWMAMLHRWTCRQSCNQRLQCRVQAFTVTHLARAVLCRDMRHCLHLFHNTALPAP